MLTKFAVTNYRGFAKRIELDLSNPNNYEYNTHAIANGVVKNGIVYGPNGSGKTNIGLAIFDIEYHLAPLKAKKRDFYNNYVYAGSPEANVQFEYTFKFDDKIVYYKYEKDRGGILRREELIVNGEFVFSRHEESVSMNKSFLPNEKGLIDNLAQNANNVSLVNYFLAFYPLPENHFLLKLQQFVNNMLWFRGLDRREFIGIEMQDNGNIEEFIIKSGLVHDFAVFLKEMSDQDFEFASPKDDDKALWYMVDGNRVPFLETVSTGTLSLELLYFWIKRMGNSSFVFIDEFDAFYHFRLSYNVCKRLFHLPCQLFLSSHNTYLMTNDLLRPDCNFIINNNHIKCLSDCTDKELRFGHNIEKIYRAGAFYE